MELNNIQVFWNRSMDDRFSLQSMCINPQLNILINGINNEGEDSIAEQVTSAFSKYANRRSWFENYGFNVIAPATKLELRRPIYNELGKY